MSRLDQLTLRSPAHFVAAMPHLIGFTPEKSLVVVAMTSAEPGSPRSIIVTQRMDLSENTIDHPVISGAVVDAMRRNNADAVLICVWTDRTPRPGEVDPSLAYADLVYHVVTELDEAGIDTMDALLTNGDRRWSYTCTDPVCCPDAGVEIPDAVKTQITAEFVGVGQALTASRAELEAEVAHVDTPPVAAAAATFVASMPTDARTVPWREGEIRALHALAQQDDPLSAAQVAAGATALTDIRVRDTYLWDLAHQDTDGRRAATTALVQIVRQVPPALVAPAATVLAIQQWQLGDGARANVALDRAMDADRDYSLGTLVGASLRSGMPPASWQQAMAGLGRDTCLHGSPPPPSRAVESPSVAAPAPALEP